MYNRRKNMMNSDILYMYRILLKLGGSIEKVEKHKNNTYIVHIKWPCHGYYDGAGFYIKKDHTSSRLYLTPVAQEVRMDEKLKELYRYILKYKWFINDYSVFPDGSIYVGIKQFKNHRGGLVIILTPTA